MSTEKIDKDVYSFIRDGMTKDFREVIDGGYNVHKYRWSGFQLLHRAAACGQTDMCEILLDQGADVNARTVRGWYTPFHLALANGWTDTAMFLIQRGADRWKHSKSKEDPYEYAAKRGFRKVAEDFRSLVERIDMQESVEKHRKTMNLMTATVNADALHHTDSKIEIDL